MNGYYEHHLSMKTHKICPFIVRLSKNPVSSPANWHKNIEILLFAEGSGRIQYGKEVLSVFESDIVIISSGVLHRVYNKCDASYYVVIIDEDFCNENGINTANLKFERVVRDAEVKALILKITERMKEYGESGDPILAAKLRLSVLALLITLCERYAVKNEGNEKEASRSEQYVKDVIEYINTNYSRPISLEELAARCGITKFHLAREFKKFTGQTLLTYTNILRCRKASMLIADGKTVTEAALECGFESLSYFSRTYKKIMGNSPSKKSQ